MRVGAALAAVCILVAPPAWAQSGGVVQQFRQLDLDGDGAVSRAEAERSRVSLFDRLDANNDGYLVESERSTGGRAAQALARGDFNGDGRISRAEAMAAPYRAFDRLDSNRDGSVSTSEIEAVRGMMSRQ